MKTKFPTMLLALLGLALATKPSVVAQEEQNGKWTFDISLYGLAAGMSGDVAARGISADLDMSFSDILDNLEFGAMGKLRVGYDRWSFNTEVIYMGLGASKNNFEADLDQWIVEPTVGYSFCKGFEALAGVRYNNLSGDITGTGPLGIARAASGTQDWWDPILGANLSLPFAKKFSLNFRGDIGGFSVGSDLTWQLFPYLGWQISRCCSLQAGYRWVYVDYETGTGANEFKYDMLTQGPQLGVTFRF